MTGEYTEDSISKHEAEKLAFFQITSADVRCLLRSTGVFTLRSIDRAIIELALSEILTKHIQNESFANILPFENNKKRDHQPRVVSVCIPYSIKNRKCRLKAEPIKVKIEVAQGEQKKTVLETFFVKNLTDGAINEFTAKVLYRGLHNKETDLAVFNQAN